MIIGGVFDHFPKLQIVIGHMGEGLPFFLPRLESTARAVPFVQPSPVDDVLPSPLKLQRPLGNYLRENIHYTFGAFNFTLRIPTKSAWDSERRRPPIPIEAGRGFR